MSIEHRTRLEYQGVDDDGIYQFPMQKVVAIPWCTTHNERFSHTNSDECAVGYWNSDVNSSCVISSGGPDHKWWMDE